MVATATAARTTGRGGSATSVRGALFLLAPGGVREWLVGGFVGLGVAGCGKLDLGVRAANCGDHD